MAKYKSLSFLGFPKHRVGDDGTVWRFHIEPGCWKILKPRKVNKKTGHLAVSLRQNGNREYFLVHRLVLLAFVGPCPEGMQCRHFPDRSPANNNLTNLQWGTPKENSKDRDFHGTSNAGERNGACVTTEETVLEIRRLYSTGRYQQKELAERFDLTRANVWCIIHGISWKKLSLTGR